MQKSKEQLTALSLPPAHTYTSGFYNHEEYMKRGVDSMIYPQHVVSRDTIMQRNHSNNFRFPSNQFLKQNANQELGSAKIKNSSVPRRKKNSVIANQGVNSTSKKGLNRPTNQQSNGHYPQIQGNTRQSSPEVQIMHGYHVSQFNGGTAPVIGNLTHRQSLEDQNTILLNHQLAYLKDREVHTTLPMKQRHSKQMNGVTSKQIIHHSKGSQSQYSTAAYTLHPQQSKHPLKSVANSSSKVENHGTSPPQALAKKNSKMYQRSPIVPKHLLYSVAQSAKKQTPGYQRRQLAGGERSPSPALNYNHQGHHQVTKLTVHINGLREGSPQVVARFGENQSASKSQQKFIRQQPLAAPLRQSLNSNKLQTPIKSNGGGLHQQLTTQSVPVPGCHAKRGGKENRQSNNQATINVQIKRQNKQLKSSQIVRSPPPKNSKQTPSSVVPRAVQQIVNTVPKKASKSKLAGGGGSAISKKSNQTTAKKNQSQSKIMNSVSQYMPNKVTPSTQGTLGLLQISNSKASPMTTNYSRKVNELYRVSEEKVGSAGSNGSQYFNPQQFMLNQQNFKNSDQLPSNNVLLPQLNQVAIQPYVMMMSQNGQNFQKKSSPSALTMHDVNSGKAPNMGSFAESTMGKQSQQSGSFINRNHIEGNQAPLSPTSSSATSSNKKGHLTGDLREVVEVPLSLSLKGKSPVGGHQSPLSVPLQGFSQATLEYLLQTSQKQNKEILTNILKNLALDAAKSSPRSNEFHKHLPSPASRISKQNSNSVQMTMKNEEEIKTPVVLDIFHQKARRSSSKSRSSEAQISSSAPPSSQCSNSSNKKSQGLYDSQVNQEPFKDITSPTLNQQNKNNTSSLFTHNGILSKPSSILQPFQSSYMIATPNNQIQDKSAIIGNYVGGVTPFNNYQGQDPFDKENRLIVMSEDPKQKQLSFPTSQANNLAKESIRLSKVQGMVQKNGAIEKSQKTQKKRKSIQDENNAPMMKSQNNQPAASSVSIFHQVMSETPLRRKNQQEPVSFSQATVGPLQELKIMGNIQPHTIKKVNDKKQFDVTVGDFMPNLPQTEKTPQPLDNQPKLQRLDSTLKNQLFKSDNTSPKTPNPFLGGQMGTQLQTHSSNQSMGCMMKKYSDKESQQDHLSSKRRPDMIIQEDFVREEFDRLSERSDLRSQDQSNGTVVQQTVTLQQSKKNVASVKSKRKVASSAAYLQSGSSKKQNYDPLLHIDSDSRHSRPSRGANFERLPDAVTIGILGSNLVSNREPLDFMETHGRARINIPNPFIYQAESSNNVASQSSMTSSSIISSDDERHDKQLNNSMVDAEDMKRMVEAKLHYIQFEKVFCHSNYHRDDLMAYFIKRHQIQMGLIPPNDDHSCCSSTDEVLSGMSNFSLEIEMLNKLHIEKNNQHKLDQLPVVIDHLLPDPTLSLYQEEATETGIKYSKDMRPRIYFKDPITKTRNIRMVEQEDELFEGSLTQELKAIKQMKNGIVKVTSAKYMNEGGLELDYQHGHNMQGQYLESSSLDEQERQFYIQQMKSCSCSNNEEGRSNGHMCERCQRDQGAIIKRRDYFSSSSAGARQSSSSFSSGREARCRRRIDQQFTTTEERELAAAEQQQLQIIDLQDIKVQPFLAWNEIDQLLTEEQVNQYLQPAILKQSIATVPPSTVQARLFSQNFDKENIDAEFEGIPELANLTQNSELMANLYFRQAQNHTGQKQLHENHPITENNGPNNKDLEQLYLNRLEHYGQQKKEVGANYQQNQMMPEITGNSYDNAVREFKWLHEVNQDGLDRVLNEEDLKTPAAQIHNNQDDGSNSWLMKPFGWTQTSNKIPLQHQISGPNNGVISDGSSPTTVGLSRAPVKRARNQVPKNSGRQKSSSSQWSCSEQKLQRQVSSAVAMDMFSNSQIKENLLIDGAGPRRLFQDCGGLSPHQDQPNELSRSQSLKSQGSDSSHTPLTFESKEDAKEFIKTLKSQFHLKQHQQHNIGGSSLQQIVPNIKCFEPSDLRRFTYALRPAVYNQVPMIVNHNEVQLEYFDFDEIFLQE